jgi:hypothetical protein
MNPKDIKASRLVNRALDSIGVGLDEIEHVTELDILNIRGCGYKTLREFRGIAKLMGVRLGSKKIGPSTKPPSCQLCDGKIVAKGLCQTHLDEDDAHWFMMKGLRIGAYNIVRRLTETELRAFIKGNSR